MISRFFKRLIKYYIDKLINWLRIKKFNLELDDEIKEFHKNWLEENEKKEPKIIEKGTFGEDGWSISIGNVDKDE